MKSKTKIWSDPPKVAIPNNPAWVSDCDDAWVAYETVSDHQGVYAVVRFGGLVDMHLSPINDEGLGSHPYASIGLRFYEFNELFGTAEIKRWQSLAVRQFVITFKDVTIDVLARSAAVLATELQCGSASAALSFAMQYCAIDTGLRTS